MAELLDHDPRPCGACRRKAVEANWVHRMLARKPRKLVAIALANKMARSIWAMLTKGEDFRVPCGRGGLTDRRTPRSKERRECEKVDER